jgi:hypothetical protein
MVPMTDEPWVPPLPAEDVGEPGWRQSEEPFCTNRSGNTYAHSVWSDSRGVFVAAITDGQNNQNTMCPWCIQESIYFNDGSGWTPVAGAVSGNPNEPQISGQLTLTGFDGGPLVLYGYGAYHPMTGIPCGLALLENGQRDCEPVDGVTDVHVVRRDLAYGALQGSLIQYDGERWGPVTAPAPGQGGLSMLWADETVVMATGAMAGTIYTLRNGGWQIENTRTLENFSAIWGFGPSDVWAGTVQGGLHHFDGTTWNEVEWPGSGCSYDSVITGMWGAGGVLFFSTSTSLTRVDGTQAQTIAQWACNPNAVTPRISSVWGNSANEVFIAVVDDRQPLNTCGTTFLLYYDGNQFHPM